MSISSGPSAPRDQPASSSYAKRTNTHHTPLWETCSNGYYEPSGWMISSMGPIVWDLGGRLQLPSTTCPTGCLKSMADGPRTAPRIGTSRSPSSNGFVSLFNLGYNTLRVLLCFDTIFSTPLTESLYQHLGLIHLYCHKTSRPLLSSDTYYIRHNVIYRYSNSTIHRPTCWIMKTKSSFLNCLTIGYITYVIFHLDYIIDCLWKLIYSRRHKKRGREQEH